jgi:hypothetical protein
MGADRFMDGREFDPADLDAYIESFAIRHRMTSDNITGQAV